MGGRSGSGGGGGGRGGAAGPGNPGESRGQTMDRLIEQAGGVDAAHTNKTAAQLGLEKQLALESQVAQIEAGKGKVMNGNGAPAGAHEFHDRHRIARTYGGKPGDWQKVSAKNRTASDKSQFEVHAVRNVKTGKVVEAKTKLLKLPGGKKNPFLEQQEKASLAKRAKIKSQKQRKRNAPRSKRSEATAV